MCINMFFLLEVEVILGSLYTRINLHEYNSLKLFFIFKHSFICNLTDKINYDILQDAAEKLPVDKAVTKEDAEAVYTAEVQFPWQRDAAEVVAEPGGVAASMATAANLNELS